MGEKDILERNLLEYRDVFADIWNVLAFHGKQIIHPEELYLCSRTGIIPVGGSYYEIIRDVTMEWWRRNCLLAYLGVENETQKNILMAPRMHNYDGIYLWKQLLENRRKLVPVASMVLNYSNQRWDKDLSTYECPRFPQGTETLLKPCVANQNIKVHNISFLDDETIGLFKSDFVFLQLYLHNRFTQMS